MRLSIRHYALGLNAILVVTLTFGALYYRASSRIELLDSMHINHAARQAADITRYWLASQLRMLKTVTVFVRDGENHDKELAEAVSFVAQGNPDARLLLYDGRQPVFFGKNGKSLAPEDDARAEQWRGILAKATDEGYIEAPVPSPMGEGYVIAAAISFSAASGARRCAAALSIPLSLLSDRLRSARSLSGEGRIFLLTNKQGDILFSSAVRWQGKNLNDNTLLRNLPLVLSTLNSEPLYVSLKEHTYLAAGAEVPGGEGWRFYLLSPLTGELDLLPTLAAAFIGAWFCLCLFVLLILYQLRKNVQYRALSEMDHLTGAGNRLAFEKALAQIEKDKAFPVCLIIIDVDGLKQYNDRLGHEAGDALLRRVTLILQRSLRENDVVYRIGGDEFAVLISGATYSTVEALIARLNAQTALMREKSALPPIYISHGLAEATSLPEMETLFIRADKAMYNYKNARRALVSREIANWLDAHPKQGDRRSHH